MNLKYSWRLLRSVLDIKPVQEWPVRVAVAFPGAILSVALIFAAFRAPSALVARNNTAPEQLMARAAQVSDALEHVDRVYNSEIEPLARVIKEYRNDERLARRIATSLVREGRRAGVKPNILLAVMLVENPWINPSARSSVGARGLMQVMPGHKGQWRACPTSLDDIESNICYGAQIFRSYIREEDGHVERALLRYNGCVNGTNTPNCRQYPSAVFARVNRVSSLSRPAISAAD